VIQGLAALLLFQSLGEVIAQLSGAPVPGPVIGLVLLLAALVWRQRRGAGPGPAPTQVFRPGATGPGLGTDRSR